MLISTALLLDSNIRNSVRTPAKLPCRWVVEGMDGVLLAEQAQSIGDNMNERYLICYSFGKLVKDVRTIMTT
jgi:hypothetical protein